MAGRALLSARRAACAAGLLCLLWVFFVLMHTHMVCAFCRRARAAPRAPRALPVAELRPI